MTEEQRYARHFALAEVGREGQAKLKSMRVLVIGAGGLGSPVSLYLAAAGVGHLTLIDPDIVQISNLQRQILFSSKHIGSLKVESGRNRLLEMNPEIAVEARAEAFNASNARDLVRAHDIVVDGSDNFGTRYVANDACVLENRPLVSGALYKFEAQISMLHSDDGPCYRCLYPEPPPPEAIPNCREAGVLGVVPGVAGTLMANEVLKWALEIGESLSGRLLHWDALGGSFFERKVERRKDCAVCGEHPSILSLHAPAPVGVEGLSADEFLHLRERARVHCLDVRDADEYARGALPGFRNVPLPALRTEAERAAWAPHDDIVVVCQSGKRSARAVEILRQAGYANARHLAGGMNDQSVASLLR